MSKVNIQGIVQNITSKTSIYTPIIEAIVNSLQAIDDTGKGIVTITLKREEQPKLLETDKREIPEIESLEIKDNGVGFNDKNRKSFDTLYSDLKLKTGGKGFGRFVFLKYFETVKIDSVFEENKKYTRRQFMLGKNQDIIENEIVTPLEEVTDTGTTMLLGNIIKSNLEKNMDVIARNILQKLLIYFINDNYVCPKIVLKETSGKELVLNEYISGKDSEIVLMHTEEFFLENGSKKEKFQVKIFKFYAPDGKKSRISLTAHNREVVESNLDTYVPEFSEDFYEEVKTVEGKTINKNFIIRSYVLSDYLDYNVSLERHKFNFSEKKSDEGLFPFSQENIEQKVAEITKKFFGLEVKTRSEKKKKQIETYVETKAIWHKRYLEDMDFAMMPFNPSDEEIEITLQKIKFNQERQVVSEIKKVTSDGKNIKKEDLENLISKISKAEMSDLAHYVCLRKTTLDLFKKSLEVQEDGKYPAEDVVHSIIFPVKQSSDTIFYQNHNLWIIDERLSFSEFISSDEPLNGGKTERTDVLVYGRKVAFRGENEKSNPITIFEFKKPMRDDFVNPSSDEDPVEQVVRYVNSIRDGKYKTPEGRPIDVSENTPFYGYVICDLTPKVKERLQRIKNFTEMPDGKGRFYRYANINLYIEVLSREKLLKDAKMRNRVFFEKLKIN